MNAVRPGERIALYKLARDNDVTESMTSAVNDLVVRKILESHEDGTVSVKAYVLDLWLRRWVSKLVGTHQFGAPAIFIDIANLTEGKGTAYVENLNTGRGEGFAGRFTLRTILDRIETYVKSLTPAMVSTRWAVNYPPGSAAVSEVSRADYLIKNIPDDMRLKGSDDILLIQKIADVEQNYPTVTHFVLVLGDKDYRLDLERLVRAGKCVHIISREKSMAGVYTAYADRYPQQVTAVTLEHLLEEMSRSRGV